MTLLFTFCLALALKDTVIVHTSQVVLRGVVIQPPNDCWICHSAGDPVVLPTTAFSLDYLLVGQGSVCAVTNTTSCVWVNTSGEAETQLRKITDQVH